MKTGIDYKEYMENIKRKHDAWAIVSGCFAFPETEFTDKVLGYFEGIEEIYDAGYGKGAELVDEELCITNLRSNISWLEQNLEHAIDVGNADLLRYKRQGRVIRRLKSTLSSKFDVEA